MCGTLGPKAWKLEVFTKIFLQFVTTSLFNVISKENSSSSLWKSHLKVTCCESEEMVLWKRQKSWISTEMKHLLYCSICNSIHICGISETLYTESKDDINGNHRCWFTYIRNTLHQRQHNPVIVSNIVPTLPRPPDNHTVIVLIADPTRRLRRVGSAFNNNTPEHITVA